MWSRHRWLIGFGALLVALSAALYLLHFAIFRDAHHIAIYLLGDLAFLPLEVLLVAIVLERVLAGHEKEEQRRKLNMPIGTFFSEMGTELLGRLAGCVRNGDELRPHLAVSADWSAQDFRRAAQAAHGFDYEVDIYRLDLESLREFLASHRDLLLMLLANPNLLEHEQFTDLLWSIFHLMEELSARPSLTALPESDRAHLAGDVRRVCGHLTEEWLRYCRHLQTAYPYIFSIVVRTHPLQDRPDATVRA
jgi:hypothetical protein